MAKGFALQASVVISNAQAYWAASELTRNLTVAMESRAVIEQAKGILIARHGLDDDEAFDRLRHHSQTENRKLRDVAIEIVDRARRGAPVNQDIADLDAARRQLGMTMLDLWTAYFALGGHHDAAALTAYLAGHDDTPANGDHDIIVHALNESYHDLGENQRLAYRRHELTSSIVRSPRTRSVRRHARRRRRQGVGRTRDPAGRRRLPTEPVAAVAPGPDTPASGSTGGGQDASRIVTKR